MDKPDNNNVIIIEFCETDNNNVVIEFTEANHNDVIMTEFTETDHNNIIMIESLFNTEIKDSKTFIRKNASLLFLVFIKIQHSQQSFK